MLEVRDLHAAYGPVRILHGVTFSAQPGEIMCLLGRNGAGKSTTLRAIMGLVRVGAGEITLDGERIDRLAAHKIPKRGIGYIPQGRRLFPELTVAENIEIGLMTRGEGRETREWVLGLFPVLRERLGQMAGTLSGGEQQMLATARALCLRPRLLMLDEPTEGLQPSMIALIRDVILQLRDEGLAILLVEQRMDAILATADRVTVIQNGRSVESAEGDALRARPETLRAHLGI